MIVLNTVVNFNELKIIKFLLNLKYGFFQLATSCYFFLFRDTVKSISRKILFIIEVVLYYPHEFPDKMIFKHWLKHFQLKCGMVKRDNIIGFTKKLCNITARPSVFYHHPLTPPKLYVLHCLIYLSSPKINIT